MPLADDTTYLYGLVDPRTNVIRYVGKADSPQERLTGHWRKRRCLRGPKNEWLLELEKLGLQPQMRVLAEVPVASWKDEEKAMIARTRRQVPGLLNVGDGGEGPSDEDEAHWTFERLLEETAQLVQSWNLTRLPTQREMRRRGAGALSKPLFAGENRVKVARLLGLPKPQTRHHQWSDDEIRCEVRALAGDADIFPTKATFVAAGRGGLLVVIREREGGAARLRQEMGLRLSREPQEPFKMLEDVKILMSRLDISRLPTRRQLTAGGISVSAIVRLFGSLDGLAQQLGVPRPRRIWTGESIIAEVQKVVDSLGEQRFPTDKELCAGGLSGLGATIVARPGGRSALAEQMGLPTTRAVIRSQQAHRRAVKRACCGPPRRRWRNETICREVLSLVENLGIERYPTGTEFAAAGLKGLQGSIIRRGGEAALAKQLGLPRATHRWSPELLEAEILRAMTVLEVDRLPTTGELRSIGMNALAQAVRKYASSLAAFATQLGLDSPPVAICRDGR